MLHLFKQKDSKTIILWYYYHLNLSIFYFNIFYNIIHSCDGKAEFSAVTPVFSVTWSFKNQPIHHKKKN